MGGVSGKRRGKRVIFGDRERSFPQSVGFSESLIVETKGVWAPYYGRSLTNEEATEILNNVSVFFGKLCTVEAQGAGAKRKR